MRLIKAPGIDTGLIWLLIIRKPHNRLLTDQSNELDLLKKFSIPAGIGHCLRLRLVVAMPGGGFINPATGCIGNGDAAEHSRDGGGWEDTQNGYEYYQDMNQLDAERDRELTMLQEQDARKLDAIEEEYRRDVAEEDNPAATEEKYREQRDSLELKFEEKRRLLAKWSEEKASEIEGR